MINIRRQQLLLIGSLSTLEPQTNLAWSPAMCLGSIIGFFHSIPKKKKNLFPHPVLVMAWSPAFVWVTSSSVDVLLIAFSLLTLQMSPATPTGSPGACHSGKRTKGLDPPPTVASLGQAKFTIKLCS